MFWEISKKKKIKTKNFFFSLHSLLYTMFREQVKLRRPENQQENVNYIKGNTANKNSNWKLAENIQTIIINTL